MRVLLFVIAAILGLPGTVLAYSDSDKAAVQGVIERQLQAFLAGDAATAYSFAAPGIRAMFPTEEIFMNMVREGYAPVYRPRGYAFGALEDTSAGLQQTVDITDTSGTGWTAVYTLARQPDGAWKITGCYLIRKPGENV